MCSVNAANISQIIPFILLYQSVIPRSFSPLPPAGELKSSCVSSLSRSLWLLSGALKGNLMNNEERMRRSEGGSKKNELRRWGVGMRGPSRVSIAFERIDIKKKDRKEGVKASPACSPIN